MKWSRSYINLKLVTSYLIAGFKHYPDSWWKTGASRDSLTATYELVHSFPFPITSSVFNMFMAHSILLSTRFFTPSKFLMVAKSCIIVLDESWSFKADASVAKLTTSAPVELMQDPFS